MPGKELEVSADSHGWIKLSRKIQNNDFWKNAGPYDERSAWIDLLLLASYQASQVYEHGSKAVIDIAPGQALTSLKGLADKWKWSYSKVSRYLNNLEQMEMIVQRRTTKYTVITIANWDKYQGQNEKPQRASEPNEAPKQAPQPKPAAEPRANKSWEEMTPAEQAAYLRK